ncbi:uncharacterized protein LOC120153535 [Hibiscus syriacus]|uniref:uncharacterized protein LOC120153535 n=1 Tax=Hibiscus syriacus TaxID=106335 RepID=UPI001922AE7F|nr:uncharacterized protein LOC120153535 [Hibiscus syriacus]
MAVLDRLPTRSRLNSFGVAIEGECGLCSRDSETRSHLFFRQMNRPVMDWDNELDWACQRLKGKPLSSWILKLAWNGYIVVIWKARKQRLFTGRMVTVSEIVDRAKEIVKLNLWV